MATPASETKISLKIIIDVKAKKVLSAEVGKDFVEFIFNIMSLPLSSVTKLLNDKDGMVGSLGTLYKSIEVLGVQYYEPNLNKYSVLKPRAPLKVSLFSFVDAPTPPTTIKLYRCESHSTYASDHPFVFCPSCGLYMSTEMSVTFASRRTSTSSFPTGFVKGAMSYMMMDNLEIKPMSISLIRSLVKDFDYLEEKEVDFVLQEGLALLKASLEKPAVLTTVFLGKNDA